MLHPGEVTKFLLSVSSKVYIVERFLDGLLGIRNLTVAVMVRDFRRRSSGCVAFSFNVPSSPAEAYVDVVAGSKEIRFRCWHASAGSLIFDQSGFTPKAPFLPMRP